LPSLIQEDALPKSAPGMSHRMHAANLQHDLEDQTQRASDGRLSSGQGLPHRVSNERSGSGQGLLLRLSSDRSRSEQGSCQRMSFERSGSGEGKSQRVSSERSGSGQGLGQEDNFSWDYIKHKPPVRYSKDFMGQRMSNIRTSLDWDFNNETPMAVTRRSKDYGEQNQIMKTGLSKGRSYAGSLDSE